MTMRTFAAGLVAAGTLAAGALVGGSTAGAQEEPTPPTIAGLLAAQGGGTDRNWYDFDILAAGVGAAGLPDDVLAALDNPDATDDEKLTVFIPNDRAFQALVVDLFGWRYWFASEAKILDKIVEVETGAPGTLATIISYHVVPGEIDSATALSVPRGTKLTTLEGSTIGVRPLPRLGTAVLVDRDRNDLNPFLVRSKLDIQASNGIAHGISLVLRPIDL